MPNKIANYFGYTKFKSVYKTENKQKHWNQINKHKRLLSKQIRNGINLDGKLNKIVQQTLEPIK